MNPLTSTTLFGYWAAPELGANLIIVLNLLGALVLGALVGYERTFRSRAAGMRTLGLVCMGSAAFTVIGGYAPLWFGGTFVAPQAEAITRVIQGIVTGIGFLGAGVIVKEGAQISGLTTAAAIWVVAAIGVLIGVGLYPAAIVLALISAAYTMWGSRFEALLPAQSALIVTLKFAASSSVDEAELKRIFREAGYSIARNKISLVAQDGIIAWHFVAVGRNRRHALSIPDLSKRIKEIPDLKHYHLSYARN